MSNKITISIAIPTYNRIKFLEQTINCFISQIVDGALDDRIEIVIGNNASIDGTRGYLGALAAHHKFIRVINHPANLGMSGNVEKLAESARGEYIWLFGDDDLATARALKRVLNSLEANNPNYIIINTSNIVSLDDSNAKYDIVGANRLSLDEDIFINNLATDGQKLSRARDWLYLTNLVSAVAFKKKLFLDALPEAKLYIRPDSVYVFQAQIIIGIARWGRLNIISDCLVLHRKNETHWSKSLADILKVSLYDSSDVLRVIKKYIPSEYKNYQKRFAAYVFGLIITAKRKGINVNRYIIDAIIKNYNCYPYNIRFLIVLLTPSIIFKVKTL